MRGREGRRPWIAAAVAAVAIALLGPLAVLLAGGVSTAASEVAACQAVTAAWVAAHPRFYVDAGSPTVACVWRPGEGSGGYDYATNRVEIKPWGHIHWDANPNAFYPVVMRHEIGHAWAATHIHLDERRGEYAAIRGVTIAQVDEDFVYVLARSLGEPGRWWKCDDILIRHGNCGDEPTASQLAALRAADFLPDR